MQTDLSKYLVLAGDDTTLAQATRNRKVIQAAIDNEGAAVLPPTPFVVRRLPGGLPGRAPLGTMAQAQTVDGMGIQIDDAIQCPDGVTVRGARSRLCVRSGARHSMVVLASADAQRITLDDLLFDGNNGYSALALGDSCGVYFNRAAGAMMPYGSGYDPYSGSGPYGSQEDTFCLTNLRFFRCGAYGLYLGAGSDSASPRITHPCVRNVVAWQCNIGFYFSMTDTHLHDVVSADSAHQGIQTGILGNVRIDGKSYFSGDSGGSGPADGWGVDVYLANRCIFNVECQDNRRGGLILRSGEMNLVQGIFDNNGSAAYLAVDPTWKAAGVTLGADAHGTELDIMAANYGGFGVTQHHAVYQASENTAAGYTGKTVSGRVRSSAQITSAVNSYLANAPRLTVVDYSASPAYDPMSFGFGDESTAITTGLKLSWYAPYAFYIHGQFGWLNTASSSGAPDYDIRVNGTSIFTTTPTIDATELTTATATTPSVLTSSTGVLVPSGALVTFHVLAAGTGAKGLGVNLDTSRAK